MRARIKWDIPDKLLKGEKILNMSPTKFLSAVPSPCREYVTALSDIKRKSCFSQSSIKYLSNEVKEGRSLDIPFLDYERPFRGFPSHEGRHTALVALRMNMEKIPVLVIGKD